MMFTVTHTNLSVKRDDFVQRSLWLKRNKEDSESPVQRVWSLDPFRPPLGE